MRSAIALSALGFAGAALGLAGAAAADDDARPDTDHMSCSGAPFEIRVKIVDVKESFGLVTVDLYRPDNEVFLKGPGRIVKARFAARSPSTEVCIHAPSAGPYAIAVYHDRNANKRFDKKAFGLPAEPYGVSNDPPMRFGPPHVDEALFEVSDAGADVLIDLRNN